MIDKEEFTEKVKKAIGLGKSCKITSSKRMIPLIQCNECLFSLINGGKCINKPVYFYKQACAYLNQLEREKNSV